MHLYRKTIHKDHLDAHRKAARENEMEILIIAGEEGSYPRLSPLFGTEEVPKEHIGIEIRGAKNAKEYKKFSDRVEELIPQ